MHLLLAIRAPEHSRATSVDACHRCPQENVHRLGKTTKKIPNILWPCLPTSKTMVQALAQDATKLMLPFYKTDAHAHFCSFFGGSKTS